MHVLNKFGVAAAVAAAALLSVAATMPAQADTGAQSGDAVIVGSDTIQNAEDFVLDGAPGVAGGYNSAGNLNRGDNIDATGDANGRAVYDGTCGSVSTTTGVGANCGSTTNAAGNLLAGSVVLRAGTKPVIRPNGSGGGVAALIADSGVAASTGYEGLPTGSIQIARMSRLPNNNATEEGACTSGNVCGGLHVYQIATDNLAIAHVTTGFDGPSGLSAQELLSIYTCGTTKWNQLPGGTSGNTIEPLIPQSGSGTRNFFLQDLAAVNGGTTVTPGPCTRTVQEHDPSGIYTDATPADAIEPFSTGKLALINNGYFANGVSPSTNGAFAKNYLTTLTGAPGDKNAVYNSPRGLYLAVRQPDLGSTTPFQPGGTLNVVKSLITDTQSAVRSASGQAEIAAAGFTPGYIDCGINPTVCTAS